jgi:hypothetical protein
VQDTYLRYEKAGDMHVGRTVTGLPTDKPEFAILPPYFETTSEDLQDTIDICFPDASPKMQLTVEYALASVVYHSELLLETLPSNHPVFNSALFTQPTLLTTLKSKVKCTLSNENPPLVIKMRIESILHFVV